MIMFLHGEDTYRSHQRLGILRKGFQDKYDPQGHNIAVFEAADFDVAAFAAAVGAQGLFSKKRLVVVKRLLTEGRKADQQAVWERLHVAARGVDDDAIVIFWEGEKVAVGGGRRGPRSGGGAGGRKAAGVKKRAAGAGANAGADSFQLKHLQDFVLKQRVELYGVLDWSQGASWVRAEAKELGGEIESQAVQVLLGLVGMDLWQLHNEIVKLVNYADGRAVTAGDVALFVRANFSENIFGFIDALATRQQAQAVRLLYEQLESGLNETYILTMIARQVRILLAVSSVAHVSQQPGVLAAQLKLHPFVVKKALAQVGRFSPERLREMLQWLLEIDERTKTSAAQPRHMLESFVVRVCG